VWQGLLRKGLPLGVWAGVLCSGLASCAAIIDGLAQLQLLDSVPPGITISSPAAGSSYTATVVVTGTVADGATADGDLGEIASVGYTMEPAFLQGDEVSFADGSFSFQFPTTTFNGPVIVTVTATDWNTNASSAQITLVDAGAIPSFTASAGNGQVTLGWDPVPLAQSYTIYYEAADLIPNESFSQRVTVLSGPETFAGLENGQIHTFLLRAHSSSGGDNWSNVLRAIPLSRAHLAPHLEPEVDRIVVSWTAIQGATGYEVLKDSSGGGSLVVIGTSSGASFVDDGFLVAGFDYYYAVRPLGAGDAPVSATNPARTAAFRRIGERRLGAVATAGSAEGIELVGSLAFVVDGVGLSILDVSSSSQPSLVGSVGTAGQATGVTVAGNVAYVADGLTSFRTIDIANPLAPVELDAGDATDFVWDVALSGGFAYVAADFAGLRLFDLSDPVAIIAAGSFDTTGQAFGIDIVGTLAYVANGLGSGLRIIDISDPVPGNWLEVGFQDMTTDNTEDVVVAGGVAFVADLQSGLAIIDVSTPSAPGPVVYLDTAGVANSIAVSGSVAYVADGLAGLVVVDVSAPAAPVAVLAVNTPGDAAGVAVGGAYAYVADRSSGVQIIDVAIPSGPLAIGPGVPGAVTALDVAVRGDYAFVAAGTGDLRVIDVSDENSPLVVGTWTPPPPLANLRALAASGDYLYAAGNQYGLVILDVSSPGSPQEVGRFNTPGLAQDVVVRGSHAFVADGNSGVQVIDVSTPASPTLLGNVATSDDASGIAVADGYAYIATGLAAAG
jgi:hypothetical protein